MTPEHRALDPRILDRKELILYRLAKKEYANLSGIGAALYPGRWNAYGQEAIYTSTEIGVPVLERLVHTPKETIPKNLAMMQISLKGDWEVVNGNLFDFRTTASVLRFRTLADARERFVEYNGLVLAIAVPSVIVPAWNVVLYPQHPNFWTHVSLKSVEPYEFDPRLFPDTALAQK